MPRGWRELGSGSYNTAYVSNDGRSVLKIQKNKEDKTDTPERSVRLWNSINAHVPPPASLKNTEEGFGWVCPFIKGQQASDEEMAEALIDIYNRTGRIVVDATAPKNFIKTPPPNSQVLCIDVGMALQMERREETYFSEEIRHKSMVSLDAWRGLSDAYTPFFRACESTHPKTVETVKALVFIKNNRPDIFDVSFLKEHPNLVTQLANAYDHQNPRSALKNLDNVTPDGVIIKEKPKPQQEQAQIRSKTPEEVKIGREELKKQRPLTLENIQESCKIELQRYINSRGSINTAEKQFEPSLITKIFRDTALTFKKIKAAHELISQIEKASSVDEIKSVLKEAATAELFSSGFKSGFATAVCKSMLTTEVALNDPDYQLQKSLPSHP